MKTLLAAVCLVCLIAGCHTHPPVAPAERTGQVTFKGKPLTLLGGPIAVVDAAPSFVAVAQDMSEKKLSDYAGKTVILSVVPSVDTSVCAIQTRRFNEEAAALGKEVVILTISMDLPMAQKRFCAAEGIEQVVTLSDYKYWDFGKKWGLRIKEKGLLARAIYVVDSSGHVTYAHVVSELTDEPDYAAAIKAAGS